MNRTFSRLLVAALALSVSSLAFGGEKKAEPAVQTATHCGTPVQEEAPDCGQICIKGQKAGKKVTCKVQEEEKTKSKRSNENWV